MIAVAKKTLYRARVTVTYPNGLAHCIECYPFYVLGTLIFKGHTTSDPKGTLCAKCKRELFREVK